MKIHTRLQVSNFLMILVPVGITLATGVLCLALVWLAMAVGGGLGFDDQEDFDEAGAGIVQVAAQALSADDDATRLSRLERLSSLLDDNAMRLVVTQNGASYYEHGAESEHDEALDDASEALSESSRYRRNGIRRGKRNERLRRDHAGNRLGKRQRGEG